MKAPKEEALPRYSIEIDEEGYPMFDGLRVQDDELIHLILSKLQRREKGEDRSAIVTECQGEICMINAFNDPLVAQSVEMSTNSNEVLWVFPTGIKASVKLNEVYVDEWNRFHTYVGEEKIPAVMSFKAQAAFLNAIDPTKLKSSPWRTSANASAVSDESFWNEAYLEGKDGWEQNEPSRVLVNHFAETGLKKGQKILAPGVGRGHDARFFEEQGLDVTAVDFAPYAKEEFHKLYPTSKVNYLVEDLFAFLAKHPQSFDAVYEHTLFVALDPARRAEYLKSVRDAIKPGGLFFGGFFLRQSPGGPPFGLTQWELRELCKNDYDFLSWKISKHSRPRRYGQELWVVLRKKS